MVYFLQFVSQTDEIVHPVRSAGLSLPHLSRLAARVRKGGSVLITEHGHPAARLVPIERSELSLDEQLGGSGLAVRYLQDDRNRDF